MAKQRLRRSLRWLIRIIAVIGCVVAGALIFQVAFLPKIVERAVAQKLAALGVPDVAVEVRNVSWSTTELANLILGKDEALRIDSLSVSYDASTIRQGRLRNIQVTGAKIRLKFRDGALDLGSLASLKPFDDPSDDPELPFSQVTLRSCSVLLDLAGSQLRIPFSASIINAGAGQCKMQGEVYLAGAPITFEGTLNPSTFDANLTVKGENLALGALIAMQPKQVFAVPALAQGQVTLNVGFVRSKGQNEALLTVFAHGVSLAARLGEHRLMVDGLFLQIGSAIDKGCRLGSLNLTLLVKQAILDGETVTDVTIHARKQAGRLYVEAKAAGEYWKLTELTGEVTELFGLVGDEESRLEAGARFAVQCELPAPLASTLPTMGVHVEKTEITLEGRAVARLARSASGWEWSAQLPALRVSLPPGDLSYSPLSMTLRDVSADLRFTIESATDEAGAPSLRTTFALEAGGDEPAVTASLGGADAAELALGKLAVSGSAVLAPASGPVVESKLEFSDGSLEWPARGLALEGLAGNIPMWPAGSDGERGEFAVGAVYLGKQKLPPVSGKARLTGTKGDFAATWRPFRGVTLRADGWADPGGEVPKGRLSVEVPEFQIEDGDQLNRLLADKLGLSVTGGFAADAELCFAGDRVEPLVGFRIEGAKLASQKYDATLDGIKADVTITSVDPISTPGAQHIEVKSANLGKLAVKDGLIAFRIEGPESLFIERTEWGWAGGRLYTHALRINPRAPKYALTVFAERLGLAEILALVPEGRATGDGSLYGRLAVAISWPKIDFGNGFLYATPGKGWIKVKDAEVVGDLLEQNDPRWAQDPARAQIKDRIVDALTDFEYSVLKTDYIREGDGVLARIHLQGKGRRGEKPQEIGGLTINLRGFDKVLNETILMKDIGGRLLKKATQGR